MTISSSTSGLARSAEPRLTRRGEARFWRISFVLFLGGFATFSLLYYVQPMMPAFARDFSLSPAGASLSLSVATGVLAVAMIGAGALSDALGRKRIMGISLAAATVAAALAPNWPMLVALRALTGLALSGVPAVAMAYLAEEMDRSAVGLAMGLYIAGSTLGGMSGRLAVAAIAQVGGWRQGVGVIGAFAIACSLLFALALPRERSVVPKGHGVAILPAIGLHFGDPGLRGLYALGFLMMGAFVTTYNYIGFRLAAPPFSLSQASIGLVFVIYLVGAVASPVAGELAERFGRRRVIGPAIVLVPLGAPATLPDNLPMTIFGVGLVTAGFFAGHLIASSWIGLRLERARAQASALYLLFYYLGSSVAGSVGGWALAAAGWPGVAAFVGALALAALAAALGLARVPPPAHLKR